MSDLPEQPVQRDDSVNPPLYYATDTMTRSLLARATGPTTSPVADSYARSCTRVAARWWSRSCWRWLARLP